MKPEDAERFRRLLNEIKENLSGIKEQTKNMNALLESDKLIPEEAIHRLISTLEDHRKKSALLRDAGKEIALTLTDNLNEIEQKFKTAEEKMRSAAEMELLRDYFRLTTDVEETRKQLEASKKKLQERLRLNCDVVAEEYRPYKLASRKVRDKDSKLTMDEFMTIQAEIPAVAFLLMQSMDEIFIDPQIDISPYLDGTGAERTVPQNAKAEQLPPREDIQSVEKPLNGEKSEKIEAHAAQTDPPAEKTEEQKAVSSTDFPEDHKKLWEQFDGYVGDTEVSFKNTPSFSLGASKFISAARSRSLIPAVLQYFGEVKLVRSSSEGINKRFLDEPSSDVINYLLKQEYFMPVTVSRNGAEENYIMLSSKGWAVYKKADIVKYLKNGKYSFYVPEIAWMPPESYTAKNMLKLMQLEKFFARQEENEAAWYTVYPETADQPLYAFLGNPDDKDVPAVVPVIFEEGMEMEEIDKLTSFIYHWDKESEIYLCCMSENDIAAIIVTLAGQVDAAAKSRVRLCTGEGNDVLHTLDGTCSVPNQESEDGTEENNTEAPDEDDRTESGTKPAPEDGEDKSETPPAPERLERLEAEKLAPAPEHAFAHEVSEHIDACTEAMLGENKLYCASAYLAAAANSYPQFRATYNGLALALNDTISKPRYSSQGVIGTFFTESSTLPDSWVIAAVIRNYFLDHVRYDYDMQGLYDTIKESELYTVSPMLKNVIRSLKDFKKRNGHGLDYYADYRTEGAVSYEANLRDLQKEAETLYRTYVEGATRENAKNERFVVAKKLIFARDGDLGEMLNLVATRQQNEANLIKEYLKETFLKTDADFGFSSLDADKLDKLVDRAWEEAQEKLLFKKNNVKFVGELRRNLIARIRACVEILCRFVELCDASAIDANDTGAIDYKRGRKELLKNISKALSELKIAKGMSAAEKADRNVLCFALREIQRKIEGTYQEEERKFFYLPFLRSEHVLLNESYLPELCQVDELPEMSSMACIERHAAATLKSIPDAIESILRGEDDYGSLDLLVNYLRNQEDEDPETIKKLAERAEKGRKFAHDGFEQSQKDFAEYLELSQSYGQINSTVEDKKETILQSARVWYEYAEETDNYGFYSKVIKAFKEKIHEEAKIRAIDLEKNLDAYKNANGKWEEDPAAAEAVRKIEERIRFQNYSAAEDMLNRLQAHDLDEQIPYLAKDYLSEFLDEYNDIARQAKTTGPFNLTFSDRTREGRAGAALLRRWPKGLGSTTERIRELLIDLGFANPKVTSQNRLDRMESFQVLLEKPRNGRKSNYTHPISIFGSEAEEKGFRVVCTFGRRQPEELIDSFNEIGNAKNTLVFLDYALTLPERRKLARLTKKNYNGKTFVVVDRVVVAFLAKHYSVTAMNRMLMAIVTPFAYYQPYVSESAQVMPPEIFMGRKMELEKIEAPDGVNIVYGGRQLGKSALLRMAQKDIDWNENGDRAVLVEIKEKDYKEAASAIAAALFDQHVLDSELPPSKAEDWNELGRAIKKVLREGNRKGRIPYLLLLIDEADAFIESCAAVNYQPFDVLKDIQSVGTGRFKFVVAGLRNVVRFNRDAALSNNSVLTHLSSLTVTPFKASDARELLQTPLHYLGFRFQDDSKTDMLISNIFGTTNYFPGLLQLYCAKLIEAMRRDYAGYDEIDTPPYMIREEHIKKVLADKTLEDQIREKFEITLKVDDDDYYYQIAVLMAFYYHNFKSQNGCSPESLLNIAKDYGLPKISALTEEEVRALMEELRELNVLQMVGNGNYRFTRLSFCEMMGLPNEIDDKIMAFATEA